MIKHSEEFKHEAVRTALNSGFCVIGLQPIWGSASRRWASGLHNIGRLT